LDAAIDASGSPQNRISESSLVGLGLSGKWAEKPDLIYDYKRLVSRENSPFPLL